MKVCYFGTYESQYPRNRILIEGLRKNNIDVTEIHHSIWEKKEDKTGNYLSFLSLFRLSLVLPLTLSYLTLKLIININKFDAIIAGYIGQLDIIFAKSVTLLSSKPLIFNPLISIYSTLIENRKIFKKDSIQAKLLFLLDKISFKLADFIITDTTQQLKYLTRTFQINPHKLKRIFVGADERYFYPGGREIIDGKFKVLFYGKFIPLHGIEYIIKAAKILFSDSDIEFTIIGKGQLKEKILNLVKKLDFKNINFIDWVPYRQLKEYINSSSVCLGIFSDTSKAKRVIPNKIFQVLACGKPLITADTPAVRELLTHEVDVILCKPASENVLAESIKFLKENPEEADKIATAGYRKFRENCNTQLLGEKLKDLIFINLE